MTRDITVCVPILNRPASIPLVMERFRGHDILFLPDRTDEGSLATLEKLGARYSIAPAAPAFRVPTYASKINHAYRTTGTPFILYAADDVIPRGDWWAEAKRVLEDERIGLLATNDRRHGLVMGGKLATHGIVRRAYVEAFGSASLPGSGPVFWEGYRHWGVDAEASAVARDRGAFALGASVIIQHYRDGNAFDSTYALGRSYSKRDGVLLRERVKWP